MNNFPKLNYIPPCSDLKVLSVYQSLIFNWDTTGMTDDEMRAFPAELGKMGFVFNFISIAALTAMGSGRNLLRCAALASSALVIVFLFDLTSSIEFPISIKSLSFK